MAQVVRNPDNTLTVTFSTKEQQLIQRWAGEHARSIANQFEDIINGFLRNKLNEYQSIDGAAMQAKYDALTAQQQASVDAILNG